jgi:putative FmdB family regulatory protein
MPTYEYECKACSHVFDAFQSINEAPIKTCPECGQEVRRRINGGMGVIFKGPGFYVTDKKGGSSLGPSKESAKPSEAAPCPGCAAVESCPKAVNS